ncbi:MULTISPECIES: response regulator transcription factor [unclassified Sphingobacterium]|uniref:response regulator n=1 Tax=unclassified Sphingobacterium TaxID=2609468 RepID=UPI001043B8A4|nr:MULTISPECIES: response regulator transcription factor [unclassified Sphingobacterium]MCS3556150.1 DNA-binding NarL/FixJ family response regulator [Sphingobacterium sp. JUb21]TCR08526.1 response regulator receiver domain-containing protein [Sphingobacterium sp. JUb20]
MLNNVIKIAIVDDSKLIVDMFKRFFKEEENMCIVGSFGNGEDLLYFLEHNHVDLILLDVSLPDTNGIDLCLKVKQRYPNICVIGQSSHSEPLIINNMLQSGASCYWIKGSPIAGLFEYIDEALARK